MSGFFTVLLICVGCYRFSVLEATRAKQVQPSRLPEPM